MSIKIKVLNIFKNFLEVKKKKEKNDIYNSLQSKPTDANTNEEKYKELETMVYGLSAKVTVLIDTVAKLNEKIIAMTILQEELLYSLERVEQIEEKQPMLIIRTDEKKYEVN